jgi:hypothetical protein
MEIFEEHVIKNEDYNSENSIFMQDGARCYAAKTVMDYLSS